MGNSLTDVKAAAVLEAQRQGVPPAIVLTTLEAETNFKNELGDNGNALGYGQIWPLYWYNMIKVNADRLGIKIPAKTDLKGLQSVMLGNDNLSLAAAVSTIKYMWAESEGGDFVDFVHHYVGRGVSDAEVSRRQSILQKYIGTYPVQGIKNAIGGMVSKTFSVQVPQNASDIVVGIAVIAFGLAMIKAIAR